MRRLVLASGLFAVAAHAAIEAPERALTDAATITSRNLADATPVPVASLFFSRGSRGAAWSPDGKQLVISTNLTGRYNLWRVSADGDWPVQLTQSDDAQGSATWSPDGHWISYTTDKAGGEVFDIFLVPAQGGAPVNVTASDDYSDTTPVWSPDGKQLAFERKHQDAPAANVTVMDVATRKLRSLTREKTPDHSWSVIAWSPRGDALYASRYNQGFSDASVWRIEVKSGRARELTPHKGEALIQLAAVSPDGRWLAVSSNAAGDHGETALYDTQQKSYRWVTHGDWESFPGSFSPDGKLLTYYVNADGRRDLFVYHTDSGQSERLDLAPGINSAGTVGSAFSPDGTRLLLTHQSSTESGDYWVLDLATRRQRQLTRLALADIDPARLPAAQLVHYKSFDGTVISAFLWLPFNLKRDGKAPAVVLPHGGPTSQTLDSFNRTAIALASRGYVCIAPNVRGSTGYGLAFQKSNYQDLGGGDLQDEVYATKFLVDTGYVDAKKIGITGGSYGGYMALIALGRTPEVWAAAVDLYGVTNWLTEQANEEPALQQYDQTLLGDPVKDKDAYIRASADTYFEHIRAPLLVLQGANDIRDPKSEAERAFKQLSDAGKTVEAHYYADEGHGFVKRENQIDALERTIAFFDRYLKGVAPK